MAGQKWTQADIGLALSVGSIAAMLGQVPGGALVDWAPSKRLVAFLSVLSITLSALLFAFWPAWLPVMIAQIVHGIASCTLGPAIAALTLMLFGQKGMSVRFGHNARYAAIGNGMAAAVLGLFGAYGSEKMVFVVTAVLTVPAMLAVLRLAEPQPSSDKPTAAHISLRPLLRSRGLIVFSACVLLFHFANAAMLPLAGTVMTRAEGSSANLLIAGAIILPQILVAWVSPWIGRRAELNGRKMILLAGFAALALRGLLLATVTTPRAILAVQVLEGVSAAVFATMMPLVAADLTRGTRRYNLCLGILGLAMGIGATLSTTLAGFVADLAGAPVAFLTLATIALAATALLALFMPETRQTDQPDAVSRVSP